MALLRLGEAAEAREQQPPVVQGIRMLRVFSEQPPVLPEGFVRLPGILERYGAREERSGAVQRQFFLNAAAPKRFALAGKPSLM